MKVLIYIHIKPRGHNGSVNISGSQFVLGASQFNTMLALLTETRAESQMSAYRSALCRV